MDCGIEVEPTVPPETSGREPINEHEPTEHPDDAQHDKMDEDDVAELFGPSEDGDADLRMVNAFITAGVNRT